MSKSLIITLDGPGGVGKSTLAHKLAQALNFPMLDTGAMYRTLALSFANFIHNGKILMNELELEAKARTFVFHLSEQSSNAYLMCNHLDIRTLPIRTDKSSFLASIVAKNPIIRRVLQENQRIIAQDFSLVVEGRDMGTKVFPHALCKFFLDASIAVRATRRYTELSEKYEKEQNKKELAQLDYETLYANLAERDRIDRMRVLDPLKPAEDALIVDTSFLSIEEVFQELYAHVHAIMTKKA